MNQLNEELGDHSPTHPAASDDQLAGKVRLVLEQGRHAPVALKHYRAGRVGSEEVAQYVSYDLTGNTDSAERLTFIVERVVAELETEEAATS